MKSLLPVFAAVMVVTLCCTWVVYWAGLRVTRANTRVIQSHDVIASLQHLLSTVKDAETGQRGFLLAGEDSYLDPYLAAKTGIAADLAQLEKWAKSGDVDPKIAGRITARTGERLDLLNRGIQVRREGGLEAGAAYIQEGAGKAAMDDLRVLVARLVAQENEELSAVESERNRDQALRTALTIAMAALQLLFLAWAFWTLQNEVGQTERQRQTLAVTLASIGDGVIVTDARGHVTFLNGEAEKLTGWSTGEARGHSLDQVFRIVNEDTRQPVESPVAKVLRLGTVVGLANHTVLIAKDGTERPIDDSGAPIREPGEEMLGVVLVFRDFSVHRHAESALRAALTEKDEALSLLRSLIEHAPMGFTFIDPDMRYRIVNAPLAAINGIAPEEHVGRRVVEIVPDLAPQIEPLFQKALSGQAVLDRPVSGQTSLEPGQLRHWLESWYPVTTDDGRNLGVGVLVQEVTERKQAEDALRESEELLRTVLDNVPACIFLKDAEGRFVLTNRLFAELFVAPGESLVGLTDLDIASPEVAEKVRANDRQVFEKGQAIAFEEEIPFGGEVRTYMSVKVPMRNAKGVVHGVMGLATDITERKRAEEALRDSEARLKVLNEDLEQRVDERTAELARSYEAQRRSERLAALGQMITGLSHESRNALQNSMAGLDVLSRRLQDQPVLLRYVEQVQKAQRDLHRVHEEVREYAAPVVLERACVSLDEVWREAWEDLAEQRDTRTVSLVEDCGGCDLRCHPDPHRLKRVFRNLFENSLQACPDPLEVRITCRETELHGKPALRIAVRDNGPGISAEQAARVFEPFYTSKPRGTGLGTSIVKRLVEEHGGHIELGPVGVPGFEIVIDLPRDETP